MAFFKKLKEKLFKSSSKLEEGLDAIVEDGGEEEVVEPQAPKEKAKPKPKKKPAAKKAAEKVEAEEKPKPAKKSATKKKPAESKKEKPKAKAKEVEAPTDDVVPDNIEEKDVAVEPSEEEDILEEQYEEVEGEKPGLLGRILGKKEEPKKKVVKRVFDDAMLESLEDLLISSDLGVDTALRVTSNIAETRFGKKTSVADIKGALSDEVTRIMESVAKPMPLYKKTPQVVLVVGVNGSGKTTTIGKLASQFKDAGKSVVIAAGDTFRAAAVEQLQIWGDRAGVPVLTAPEGSDPASLAFEAMTKAEEDGADLLMIDTAGRLQNRTDLMQELEKIVRVIRKKDDTAPHNTLLVLDATTGQNALKQVEVFQEVADVSGLIMTKLDGTAKGGVLVALADKFGLPIHAIGVGEQIDDLQAFDPEDFSRALTGT